MQLVKSFEGELFHGAAKKVFSWLVFVVYGLAIMIGVSGNINGGAQIFTNWFGMPMWAAQLVYYGIAGCVVFMGMKAVGIAQKYAVVLLMGIVAAMTAGTLTHPVNTLYTAEFHWNNLLALYSMVVFATSANQAVIQVVKGLDGNPREIRKSIFIRAARLVQPTQGKNRIPNSMRRKLPKQWDSNTLPTAYLNGRDTCVRHASCLQTLRHLMFRSIDFYRIAR